MSRGDDIPSLNPTPESNPLPSEVIGLRRVSGLGLGVGVARC